MPTEAEPLRRPEPPSWLLFVIAVPIGVLLYGISGGWDRLADAIAVLTADIDNSLLRRWTERMTTHLVLPALAVYLALRLTRLGSWLAPNRLAVGALLVTDALILGYWIRGAFLATMFQNPYLFSDQGGLWSVLLIVSGSLGLVVLIASTLWHRCVIDKERARRWTSVLLRPL